MPARSTPPPQKGAFYPPNDVATYRDLLLFEERLKSNAARLQQRKARYQLFLLQLLLVIAFLLSEVLLPSSLLAIPYKMLLQRLLPEIYTQDVQVTVHPYFSSGLLFVSVTTLVLFFASGMYTEKIGYANKYVPHANRALRSFNMYLNVRKPPLRSKFYTNPLSFFFPRPSEPTTTTSTPPASRSRSPAAGQSSPNSNPRSRSPSPAANSSVPIPSIPPASNPRGELIFSSRIDKSFRDAYERYRAAFERRRKEKERDEATRTSVFRFFYRFRQPPSRSGSPVVGGAPSLKGGSSSSSAGTAGRKAGSRSGTPPVVPCPPGTGITMRQRDRSGPPEEDTISPPAATTDVEQQWPSHGEHERMKIRGEGMRDALRTLALERLSHQARPM